MESELFGHAKGSFSGAVENKKGLVELAHGGTAFFDEIGDLPLEMQVKLLRLLQEREFRPVGALKWHTVDLRVIAATHRDLKGEVGAGRFRRDLFYRLDVFVIHLPPLREHKEDIPLLMRHFLEQGQAQGLPEFRPGPELTDRLLSYDWPGNVRELKHCLERIAAISSEGALEMADLPSALQHDHASSAPHSFAAIAGRESCPEFTHAPPSPVIPIHAVERKAIERALSATGRERGRAAQMLGIGRTTLYRKMKEYGID
jgi:DNA-binding NtrC family response regulator